MNWIQFWPGGKGKQTIKWNVFRKRKNVFSLSQLQNNVSWLITVIFTSTEKSLAVSGLMYSRHRTPRGALRGLTKVSAASYGIGCQPVLHVTLNPSHGPCIQHDATGFLISLLENYWDPLSWTYVWDRQFRKLTRRHGTIPIISRMNQFQPRERRRCCHGNTTDEGRKPNAESKNSQGRVWIGFHRSGTHLL